MISHRGKALPPSTSPTLSPHLQTPKKKKSIKNSPATPFLLGSDIMLVLQIVLPRQSPTRPLQQAVAKDLQVPSPRGTCIRVHKCSTVAKAIPNELVVARALPTLFFPDVTYQVEKRKKINLMF